MYSYSRKEGFLLGPEAMYHCHQSHLTFWWYYIENVYFFFIPCLKREEKCFIILQIRFSVTIKDCSILYFPIFVSECGSYDVCVSLSICDLTRPLIKRWTRFCEREHFPILLRTGFSSFAFVHFTLTLVSCPAVSLDFPPYGRWEMTKTRQNYYQRLYRLWHLSYYSTNLSIDFELWHISDISSARMWAKYYVIFLEWRCWYIRAQVFRNVLAFFERMLRRVFCCLVVG